MTLAPAPARSHTGLVILPSSRLLLSLVTAALAAIACSSTQSSPTADAGDAPACIKNHAECKDKFDCCSANCVPQGDKAFCQEGDALCSFRGTACTDPAQCCTRTCEKGICVAPPPTGVPGGGGGGGGGNGGSGGGSCGEMHASCRVASDCCRGNCANGSCT